MATGSGEIFHPRRLGLRWGILLFSLAVVCHPQDVRAVSASPDLVTLRQPDGAKFQARQWGDEFGHGWETPQGEAITIDGATRRWVYLTLDGKGNVMPSTRTVGSNSVRGLKTITAGTAAQAAGMAPDNSASAGDRGLCAATVSSSGSVNVVALCVNFSDTAPMYSTNQIQSVLFGNHPTNATGPGSFADYYREVSYGQLSVAGDCYGWYTASHPHAYYGNSRGMRMATMLLLEALNRADAQVDFRKYDNDGDGMVDVVMLIHQGFDSANSGNTNDIWAHCWSLTNAGLPRYLTDDGVYIDKYLTVSEALTNNGHLMTVGTSCHEFGHAMGLPDLYDTTDITKGIGRWGLMGSGNWLGTVLEGDTPSHPCAYSKIQLGWVVPTEVTNAVDNAVIHRAEDHASVFELRSSASSHQSFLVENRRKTGFDQALPGEGVLIWHVDDQWKEQGNAYPNMLLGLEQADGHGDLETGVNKGDSGDPYDSGDTFDDTTVPSSRLSFGSASGVAVSDIHSSGDDYLADLTRFNGGVTPEFNFAWDASFGSYDTNGAPLNGGAFNTVTETDDGGYLAGGACMSTVFWNGWAWLVKITASGGEEWSRTYGVGQFFTLDSDFHMIRRVSDGNYLFAGHYGRAFWAGKMDGSGNILWEDTGRPYTDNGCCLLETTNNQYVVMGLRGERTLIMKFDRDGSVMWVNTNIYAVGDHLVEAQNGDLVLEGKKSGDAWLARFDSEGNLLWESRYGRSNFTGTQSGLCAVPDGGFAMAGYNAGTGPKGFVYRLDADGSLLWSLATNIIPTAIINTSDGGFAFLGYEGDPSDTVVVKLDAAGNTVNTTLIEPSGAVTNGANTGRDLQSTSDGGYMFCGVETSTRPNPVRPANGWFVKVNGAGQPGIIVRPGSSLTCGVVRAGNTDTQWVSVANIGGANLAMGAVSLSGTHASDFSIVMDQVSHTNLWPHSQFDNIELEWSPPAGATGTRTAQLNIPSNDPDDPIFVVRLAGTVRSTTSASPSSASFGFSTTGTTSTLDIENPGTNTLEWSVSSDQSWLTVDQSSGTTTGETDRINVSVDPAGMAPGVYTGTLMLQTADGETQFVTVVLDIKPPVSLGGRVELAPGLGLDGAVIQFAPGLCATTAVDGVYSQELPYGWCGDFSVERDGFAITPPVGSLTNFARSVSTQDFAARLQVDLAWSNGGPVNLEMTGLSNYVYRIEAAEAVDSTNWTTLHSAEPGNTNYMYTDSEWTNHPMLFYRVQMAPAD